MARDNKSIAEDKKTTAKNKKTTAKNKKTTAKNKKNTAEDEQSLAEDEQKISKDKRIQIRLNTQEYEKLINYCQQTMRSQSDVIREIIRGLDDTP